MQAHIQLAYLVLNLIGSYLLGSIPFGYWFARRAKGGLFDIRDWGSSNIGFTNVWKVLGIKIGLPVLIADILKGLVPVLLCKYFFGEFWGAIALICAALGHAKSIYFFWKEGVFSGGKAVATLLGGILALQPIIALVALIVWGIVLKTSKYMSVASLSGALMALVCAFLLHKNPLWFGFFGFVFLAVVITHLRNIGRLISGVEPKITQNRGAGGLDPKKKIVAFALHPRNIEEDVKQMTPWLVRLLDKKRITEKEIKRIILKCPVLESDEITNIVTKDGHEATVLITAIPLLPDQIKNDDNANILDAMLKAALVQSQRRGATVFTLGALLSTKGNGGSALQKWAINRGLTIKVDNGAAFTIAATMMAMEREAKALNKPLSECVIATVGATGFIGGMLVRSIEDQKKAKKQLAYVRDKSKIKDPVAFTEYINSQDLSGLIEADIVILTTSSTGYIITPENCHFLKQGAIIIDVAEPKDFDNNVLGERTDLILIRSGLVLMPGDPKWKIDLHFGSVNRDGKETKLVPACLAQGTILGVTEQYQHASNGSFLRTENVEFFAREAEKLGYEIITSEVSEAELFMKVVKK